MDQKIKELEGQSGNYYTDIPMDACYHYVTLLNLRDQIVSNDKDGLYRIEINQIGLYVRDTYEFMNDGDDQPFGYWGWHGVIKPSLINELFESKVVSKNGNDYYRVTNNSFIEYREKCKKEKT
ncbi:DUF6402 family protein [Cronobacter sakazakii]|uniref:DUF6402 family protein n=1 Tax=Cronobacter sakazakii TaxID=28141 RepID=UPI000CFDEA7D|nr:DUF6402 family protein [Cronobacter sakazakii]EGT4510557.1 hypothetical protein [Cronobacter sakazakii]EJC1155597.1 hypothetical protein [Cronobacter sakazakii]EJC1184104.1 hypothetical protein [Cronobacter sakazakii]EJC1244350.1 hypothetical protein [Cronobacter sakazakii]EJC2073339.1 hypothetical protein [Cronobacter sakazakii]